MNPFDELTLAEVEEMTTVCFNGADPQDTNPFTMAGGILYMHRKRDDPALSWSDFKSNTRMHEINAYAQLMKDDDESENPMIGVGQKS